MTRLKELRLQKGLTQKQAAEAIGIAESAYQRYEHDTIPLAPMACKIAKALGTTVEEIYGE